MGISRGPVSVVGARDSQAERRAFSVRCVGRCQFGHDLSCARRCFRRRTKAPCRRRSHADRPFSTRRPQPSRARGVTRRWHERSGRGCATAVHSTTTRRRVVICREGFRYPETVRWAARHGAQVVFRPHYDPPNVDVRAPRPFSDPSSSFREKWVESLGEGTRSRVPAPATPTPRPS
jgi:hypothetical protein